MRSHPRASRSVPDDRFRVETCHRGLNLTPGILNRSRLPNLIATVPALRAPLRSTVDGTQVLQHERQIGAFTHCYNVVYLAAVHAARYRVFADPADRPVRLVDEAAQLLPPVTATAHLAGARRFYRHNLKDKAWIPGSC